jgi:hypothetical protein
MFAELAADPNENGDKEVIPVHVILFALVSVVQLLTSDHVSDVVS